MMNKMCESVQRFITHIEDHWKEEERSLITKEILCPTPTDAQLVVECLCDIFLGENWYVVFPLHTTQVNTCILDEILYKYYRPYRKYISKKNKELMKRKKNNVG